jgi:hypothetical protein
VEVVRIVENQASLSSYRATQNEDRAVQLELLIEATKPGNFFTGWHPLIATPFRYNPPHPQARFRPLYGRNVFYGSLIEETALYEHAFHFMKQRMHLNIESDTGIRTIFFIDANNHQQALHVHTAPDVNAIIDKNDYSASHQFIQANKQATFILYPSCRDPLHRDNAAILDINHLGKNPKWEAAIKYFYDNNKQEINWLDYHLHIQWTQVA